MVDIRLAKKMVSIFLILIMIGAAVLYPSDTGYAATVYVTDNGSSIVVNTGSGLEYTVNKDNGDITSAKMNGTELSSSGGKGSHIASGLGSAANVTWSKSPSGSTVLITVSTDTLTHYYSSRGGENIIYMATYVTAQPSVESCAMFFKEMETFSPVCRQTLTIEERRERLRARMCLDIRMDRQPPNIMVMIKPRI